MEFNKPRGTRDFLFEDMEERKYVDAYKEHYSEYTK